MWLTMTLLTFLCWGIADLFYKLGNKNEEKYNHLKTGIVVGIVMGIHAIIYLIIKKVNINIMDIIKYLPVSLCYISSMIIGYRGLRYLELSICSPIQNTSGVITSILLIIFFKENYDLPIYCAFLIIFIGILLLSTNERSKENKIEINIRKKNKLILVTLIFPICYCILDGLGTFLDAIYLDKMEIINEDAALISYEFTFLIYAFVSIIYLKLKKEKIFIFNKDKSKLIAAIFETAGQFFYVYAMSGNSTISSSIIGSYCVLSFVLSHIFLKEKLEKKEYISLILVIIGIIILSIYDI